MKNLVKISVLLCLVLLTCALLFTACEEPDNGGSEGSETESTPVFEGLSKDEWTSMLSTSHFENYTLNMEGTMDVLLNGVKNSTNNVSETLQVTADKLLVTLHADDTQSDASDQETILLEREQAKSHKDQYSWLFLTMLEQFDSYRYDKATKTYKLTDDVVIEKDMEGFISDEQGLLSTFTIPTKLEIRDAEVSVSEDGKLLKLVCDYSQTTAMGTEGETTVSGVTTWTFSNYGTTVITQAN